VKHFAADCRQREVTVIKRTVFFVSDQTGITAETMGHSLMTQFDGIEFRQVTVPFISTVDKAIEAVRKIDLVAAQEGVRPVVFSTLVQEDVRNVVRGQHTAAGRRAQRGARQYRILFGFFRPIPITAGGRTQDAILPYAR